MANTAATSPGTMADDATVGNVAWSNPDNAKIEDGTFTVSANYLSTGGSEINDYAVRIVKDGSIGSTDKSISGNWSTTNSYASYGSSSDLWGETWSPADINGSTFGFVISGAPAGSGTRTHYLKATNFGFSIPSGATINGIKVDVKKKTTSTVEDEIYAYVDHIRITIYYTEVISPLPSFNR